MAFPAMFLLAQGDPFGVSEHSAQESMLKKYSEVNSDGKLVFRFAENARFLLLTYNILFRHRTMAQGDIYLKQHQEDANLTIEQLKELMKAPGLNPWLTLITINYVK